MVSLKKKKKSCLRNLFKFQCHEDILMVLKVFFLYHFSYLGFLSHRDLFLCMV